MSLCQGKEGCRCHARTYSVEDFSRDILGMDVKDVRKLKLSQFIQLLDLVERRTGIRYNLKFTELDAAKGDQL